MAQLFFLLECNLSPLQHILRRMGYSAVLPSGPEINLPDDADDPVIIARVAEQKESLGIDRIIITRDKKNFTTYVGNAPIKIIVLSDTNRFKFERMRLKLLCQCIVAKAAEMISKTTEQAIAYIECSQFY